MFEIQMSQTEHLEFLKFEFWICFGFRYSDFGFFESTQLVDLIGTESKKGKV